MKRYFFIRSISLNWTSPIVHESELDCLLSIRELFSLDAYLDVCSFDILYFDTDNHFSKLLRTVTRDDI